MWLIKLQRSRLPVQQHAFPPSLPGQARSRRREAQRPIGINQGNCVLVHADWPRSRQLLRPAYEPPGFRFVCVCVLICAQADPAFLCPIRDLDLVDCAHIGASYRRLPPGYPVRPHAAGRTRRSKSLPSSIERPALQLEGSAAFTDTDPVSDASVVECGAAIRCGSSAKD